MKGPSAAPSDIAKRLEQVRREIRQAAEMAHRSADSVRLVAVSKYQDTAAIEAAYAAGQRDFGENYAQELAQKAAALAQRGLRPTWHFIGRLQRNKVARVVEWADVIHSVDSLRLAECISRAVCAQTAPGVAVVPKAVLLQVNFEGDAQKGGVPVEAVLPLAQATVQLNGLCLWGLMAVLPDLTGEHNAQGTAAGAASAYFEMLARLQSEVHVALAGQTGQELSMGMSHDFASAIGAGATLVRVGTAIFGPRPPRRSAP